MPDDDAAIYQVQLEGDAKQAVSQIAALLQDLRGSKSAITPEEVLQRALGTELYLLSKVREKATIAVESSGGRIELDLTE